MEEGRSPSRSGPPRTSARTGRAVPVPPAPHARKCGLPPLPCGSSPAGRGRRARQLTAADGCGRREIASRKAPKRRRETAACHGRSAQGTVSQTRSPVVSGCNDTSSCRTGRSRPASTRGSGTNHCPQGSAGCAGRACSSKQTASGRLGDQDAQSTTRQPPGRGRVGLTCSDTRCGVRAEADRSPLRSRDCGRRTGSAGYGREGRMLKC